MPNPFRKNRMDVQNTIIQQKFLIPLHPNNLPLEIVETKTKDNQLSSVRIIDVPVAETNQTKSWILDLEITHSIFSKPEWAKTVEKALIVLGTDTLYIFLIEMKNSLHIGSEDSIKKIGIAAIKKKVEDSIDRISLLLPIYEFDKGYDNIHQIEYKSLIFYNHDDNLHQQFAEKGNTLLNDDLFQIWKGQIQTTTIKGSLPEERQIEFFFFKNQTEQKHSFEVSFKQFFHNDWEYEAAKWGDQTCPVLLKKN